MLWFLPMLVAAALGVVEPAAAPRSIPPVRYSRNAALAALNASSPRVRTTNAQIAALIRDGIKRSITFADLVTQLSATDLIVYVEGSRRLPRMLDGRMLFLPLAGQQRYARVEVRVDLPLPQAVGIIAHELQHALEVARQPEIRDSAAVAALYRRIGIPGRGDQVFDTTDAKEMGRIVRLEAGS